MNRPAASAVALGEQLLELVDHEQQHAAVGHRRLARIAAMPSGPPSSCSSRLGRRVHGNVEQRRLELLERVRAGTIVDREPSADSWQAPATQRRQQPGTDQRRLARTGWADDRDEATARRRCRASVDQLVATEEVERIADAERAQTLVRVGDGRPGTDSCSVDMHGPASRSRARCRAGRRHGERLDELGHRRRSDRQDRRRWRGAAARRPGRADPAASSSDGEPAGLDRRLTSIAATGRPGRERRTATPTPSPPGRTRRPPGRPPTPSSCSGAAYTGEPTTRSVSAIRRPSYTATPKSLRYGVAVGVEQHVARLHVTMDDARPVGGRQRAADLLDQRRHGGQRPTARATPAVRQPTRRGAAA